MIPGIVRRSISARGGGLLLAAGHTLVLAKGGCRADGIGLASFCNDGGRISLRMTPRSSEERPREIKQGRELWVELDPQIHAHLEPTNVGSLQV